VEEAPALLDDVDHVEQIDDESEDVGEDVRLLCWRQPASRYSGDDGLVDVGESILKVGVN
jgi:hypothetical protein